MGLLGTVVVLLCSSSILGLILPITKTDGTLDVSSLMSHIALLEQSIEDKASASEMEQLKSDLAAAQKDLTVSKNELAHLTSDLAASKKELAHTKTELGDTKVKLAQIETKLDGFTETNSDQDQELKEVRLDLKKAEIEIAVLKNQHNQKDNTSGNGVSQPSPEKLSLTSEVSHLKTDLIHLKNDVVQLQSLHNNTGQPTSVAGGTTFTRWGRTSCPADNNIVYKGYTGGTRFTDKASSASILCLPDQPIYTNNTVYIDTGDLSFIYGTEYETYYGLFKSLLNEDMPCVVCENYSKVTSMMLPARNGCYPGWTLEYSGYLLGPSARYASGEYICVDAHPEAVPGGQADEGGQLLYHVEGRCGSLPCPPYQDYRELTCAVCSK